MRLAVSTEVVLEELQSASAILTRSSGALAKGIPGVDGFPASRDERVWLMRQF